MGVYSELDLERQYGDEPFVEDDPFVENDPFVEVDAPAGDNPFVEDDALAPAGADGAPAVTAEPEQAEDTPAVQPQAAQAPASDKGGAQPAADKAADEDAKRKAHEEAEAKRKAEWEAKQAQKKADEQKKLDELAAMSDEELMTASTQRVSADTEKITRRNMMECVMEHIQTMCLDDTAFARKVMHPRKNMIRCYQYINRKAWEYVQDEMKAKGITPGRDNPSYASAIPEGICYQWAVDYFNDPDAKEDHEEDEKFVPQPYRGTTAASAKKSTSKGKGKETSTKGKAEKAAPSKAKQTDEAEGQLSLLGAA